MCFWPWLFLSYIRASEQTWVLFWRQFDFLLSRSVCCVFWGKMQVWLDTWWAIDFCTSTFQFLFTWKTHLRSVDVVNVWPYSSSRDLFFKLSSKNDKCSRCLTLYWIILQLYGRARTSYFECILMQKILIDMMVIKCQNSEKHLLNDCWLTTVYLRLLVYLFMFMNDGNLFRPLYKHTRSSTHPTTLPHTLCCNK